MTWNPEFSHQEKVKLIYKSRLDAQEGTDPKRNLNKRGKEDRVLNLGVNISVDEVH